MSLFKRVSPAAGLRTTLSLVDDDNVKDIYFSRQENNMLKLHSEM